MQRGIQVKTILNKTRRRDPWFLDEYTLNPYSGCSFNCLYCYIRGSKYGEHMEEKLSLKTNAAELLDKQLALRAKKNQYGIIVLSSATDPYLQAEQETGMTRRLLEIISRHRFPLHVITKSDLVVRDFDILRQIRERAILPADLEEKVPQKLFITFSFSTIDPSIAKIFEPGATLPAKRLAALKTAVDSGFHSGVSMMPMLPYITDTGSHLEEMYHAFKNAGAKYLFPASITLFGNGPADSKTLILRAVEKHYPELLEKYRRFFDSAGEMPAYYTDAFSKKTDELGLKYGLKKTLLNESF